VGLLTSHAELWQRAWCNQLWWAWADDGRVPRVASPRRASTAAVAGGWAASGGGTMGDADQVALAHSQGSLSDDGSGSDAMEDQAVVLCFCPDLLMTS
jgi:hypothetical protein